MNKPVSEPVATNDQVNRDAASVVPTSATENGGSGSTHCSATFAIVWGEQ